MTYILEPMTDKDAEMYPPKSNHWVANKEENIYLIPLPQYWQEVAEGDDSQRFKLYIGNDWCIFKLLPKNGTGNGKETARIHIWDSIIEYKTSNDSDNLAKTKFIPYLKETLSVYGAGWAYNQIWNTFEVHFNF